MKFKPILFSTPMVKAIINGQKTQTRRLRNLSEINKDPDAFEFVSFSKDYSHANFRRLKGKGSPFLTVNNPYGKPGDVLWVRETWAEAGDFASSEFANSEVVAFKTEDAVFYPSFLPLDTFAWNWQKMKWKPSIHMPKQVCRLFLEEEHIRLERLHGITKEDAKAEGIKKTWISDIEDYCYWKNYINDGVGSFINPIDSFKSLWKSINGKTSWNENPWVWVVGFKQIDRPENFK